MPEKIQDMILYGSGDELINFQYNNGSSKSNNKQPFEGIISYLEQAKQKIQNAQQAQSEDLTLYQNIQNCPKCDGYRLKKESLCIKINNLHIGQVCSMNIEDAKDWILNLNNSLSEIHKKIAYKLIIELSKRFDFLKDVGLEYLTLDRHANTLSGGESQRIRLASQIGSGLSGVLYVLDEPSIGLHQRDNERLLNTLKTLRDLGNTVIVVEHDMDTMEESDYLIDVGPGAGIHGGKIVAEGTAKDVADNPDSITGQYLSGKMSIPIPQKSQIYDDSTKYIEIKNASSNNLQNVCVKIPLKSFVVFTGVSGSGKSSIVINTLYKYLVKKLNGSTKAEPGQHDEITGVEHVDKIIQIDQSPIGRTPRSNPATYTGAFNYIRDWFVGLPQSKARGYAPGRFSFNVKGGRCEFCEGDGIIKIEMHFLPDVFIKCDECQGARYNAETLEIKYNNKSISDVLNMTVDEALEFFQNMPLIREKIFALQEVGLGYIKIGQSATTLSGGEAQRVKLAKELSKKSTGRTIYILDEPTTGLHIHDIKQLLNVLHRFVEAENTVIVIEHNLDVIKTADYIIDIGPEGGNKGGHVVATGTPFDVSQNKNSITGKYLREKYFQ